VTLSSGFACEGARESGKECSIGLTRRDLRRCFGMQGAKVTKMPDQHEGGSVRRPEEGPTFAVKC
jgi:hypothetical protein